MEKYCPKCGNKLPEEAVFCGKCGANLAGRKIDGSQHVVTKQNVNSSSTPTNTTIRDSVDNTTISENNSTGNKPHTLNSKLLIAIFAIAIVIALIIVAVIALPKGNDNQNPNLPNNQDDNVSPIIGESDSITNITLSEYITKYNSKLRSSVSTTGSRNVSDSDYISCAKTLIDKQLKNPSSAQYNKASVYEKDSYGRAIVYLDVSAQNSFGGWVRSEYYVCIQSVDSDGTFHYSTYFSYTDDKSSYDLLLLMNDFGEDPADEELEGLIMEDNALVKEGSFSISPSQTLDCHKAVFDAGIMFIYVDAKTKNVVSTQFSIDNNAPNTDCEKIISASIAALTDSGMYSAKSNAANIISFSSLTPLSNAVYYHEGFVYDCCYGYSGVDFAVTVADKNSFEKNLYWTPNNEEIYFEKLADQYAENKDYDNAIIYYQEAMISGEKLSAVYYGKAEQSLNAGDLDTAGLYFGFAGNYKDSAVRVLEVYYSAGKRYEGNNDYISAIQSYKLARDYSDAKTKFKECNYKQGEIYIKNKQYLEASTCFNDAADFDGASEKYKEACYLYAEQQLLIGSTDTASSFFKKAGNYKDSSTRMSKYHYDKGIEQLANKDYLSAVSSFKQILDYSDASEKYKEANYLYGEQLLEQGQVEASKTYFYNAKGYYDADTRIQRYYYEAGVALLRSTEYLKAADKFTFAGTYSDSTTKQKECYYKYGKAQLAIGHTTTGISYMEMSRGFKDADEYVLSHYYKEAEALFNTYLNTPKDFDRRYTPTYESVMTALKRCEGYGNSSKMISVLEIVHGFWLSADKAFSMIDEYRSVYTYHIEGFTATYTDSTITLYERALQNAYNNSNEATIVTDYNKSYFKATVKNVFERYPWGGDSRGIIRCIIAMFTNNYDDVDLKSDLGNENWTEVGEGYKLEIYYGGYNIVITSSHENYAHTDLIIEASK